jgi:hypothetical protein
MEEVATTLSEAILMKISLEAETEPIVYLVAKGTINYLAMQEMIFSQAIREMIPSQADWETIDLYCQQVAV